MENLEFKGTSGDWKCYRKTDKHKIEQVRVGAEIICHVPIFMNEHSVANAKLIASAPAMLKALIQTFEWLHNDQGYSMTNPYMKDIEQAIEKSLK